MNPDRRPTKRRRRTDWQTFDVDDFPDVQEVQSSFENTNRGYVTKTTTTTLYPNNDPSIQDPAQQSLEGTAEANHAPEPDGNRNVEDGIEDTDRVRGAGYWKVLCVLFSFFIAIPTKKHRDKLTI